ncbi:MAG: hypothetical protein NC340_07645 [Ruminococcus flavefaciens]|nr:hypothetical protein [Ruminococcus flavefaciens]MCM1229375.1 hypothetical protein [Ruminococcus flavefaciens]
MTDKELRRLKRSELLELMFYLREELDKLKEENESLKSRLDDLARTSIEVKSNQSDEFIAVVKNAVKEAVESSLSNYHKNNNSDSSADTSSETEQ